MDIEQQLGTEAAEIIRLHAEISGMARRSLDSAIRIGELALRIQESLPYGQWEKWVADNLPVDVRTIRNYIRCYNNREALRNAEITDLSKAYQIIKTASRPENVSDLPSGTLNDEATVAAAPAVPAEPEPVRDATGYPIPSECLVLWNRSQEIQDLLTELSQLKSKIVKAWTDKDPLFAPIGQYAVDELEKAYYTVAGAKPYAVCTQCQGHPNINPTACLFCNGTGFIPKRSYDRDVPAETKRIRNQNCQ